MNRIEVVTLKDPDRFSDWMSAREERIQFLVDVMFTMRQQYPDAELVFSLDSTDDDAVIVEPSGSEPVRFRVSECRAINETLQPCQSGAGYCDFVRSYTEWYGLFEAWVRGYREYMTQLEQSVPKDELGLHQERKTE